MPVDDPNALPAPSGSPATDFAVILLAELERAGVRDVVLSPGSRSQALALTAAELRRSLEDRREDLSSYRDSSETPDYSTRAATPRPKVTIDAETRPQASACVVLGR